MATTILPFLMFEGRAEEAMNFYVALFSDGKIENIARYAAGEAGAEGSVKVAKFSVAGQTVMCIDSPAKHALLLRPRIRSLWNVNRMPKSSGCLPHLSRAARYSCRWTTMASAADLPGYATSSACRGSSISPDH
jgi:hypothetical protein